MWLLALQPRGWLGGPGTWGEECMRPPQHTSSQVLKQSSSREL